MSAAVATDRDVAVLRRWIDPRLRATDAPIARDVDWLVLDDVFDPELLDELARRQKDLRYKRSGALTPFDSHYVLGREGAHFGTELWCSHEWQSLARHCSASSWRSRAGSSCATTGNARGRTASWVHSD